MKHAIYFSDDAIAAIDILQLPGESFSDCVDRLIGNLLPIAEDYEEFFGEQRPVVPAAEEEATK